MKKYWLRFGAITVMVVAIAATVQRPVYADWQSLSGGFLPAHVTNVDVKVSPNSTHVAYIADTETDGVKELYLVPIAGGTPRKLNPTLVAGGDVESFQFTPDSTAILYRADQDTDNMIELYRVLVAGGDAVKISGALTPGGNVGVSVKVEGSRVVYLADGNTNDVFELYSVSITGGGLFKISGSLVNGGDVNSFDIESIQDRVVFSADALIDGTFELFSVPILGGARIKLNDTIQLQGGGDSGIVSGWKIHPSLQAVLFIQRKAGSTANNLYFSFTAAAGTTQVASNLSAEQRILDFHISPLGDRVAYNVGTRDGTTNAFKGNLYSSLISGGDEKLLTEAASPTFGVGSFLFAPDGSRVVYNYQKDAASPVRLESSITATGIRSILYSPTAAGPFAGIIDVSANSQWVAYTTGNLPNMMTHAVPIGGGSQINFSGAYLAILPDSSRIIYRGDDGPENQSELISEQIFGGSKRNLSGMDFTGYIGATVVSPNSAFIVFLFQGPNQQYDLRVSDGNVAQPTPTATSVPTQTPVPSPVPSSTNGQGLPQVFVNRPIDS